MAHWVGNGLVGLLMVLIPGISSGAIAGPNEELDLGAGSPAEVEVKVETDRTEAVRLEVEAARDELSYRAGRVRRAIKRHDLSTEDYRKAMQVVEDVLSDVEHEVRGLAAPKDTAEDAQRRLERAASRARDAARDLEEEAARSSDRLEAAFEDAASELAELGEMLEEASEHLVDDAVESTKKVRAKAAQLKFAGDVTVAEDEEADDIVTMGGTVRVYGKARDVVSIGGNIIVFDTGVIEGDAVAIGGRVDVRSGGRVLGEKVNVNGIDISIHADRGDSK